MNYMFKQCINQNLTSTDEGILLYAEASEYFKCLIWKVVPNLDMNSIQAESFRIK